MPIVLEGPVIHWISPDGFDKDPYVDYLFEKLGDNARKLYGYSEDMKVNKFSADIFPDTDYETIKRELSPYMDMLEHEGTVVEFVLKGTSKADGIRKVCEHYGAKVADTYAIGDSINDVDMLRCAGHGICMGNGTAPARAASEFITTDLYEDGIYNALAHYALL